MTLSELFGSLRKREQSHRATAKSRYLELVAAAGAGRAIDADEAAELLDQVGKDAAAFEADVRATLNRRELRARIEKAKAARPKLRKIEERLRGLEAEFQLAHDRFREDVAKLQAEAQPLQAIIARATGAEGHLVESCPDDGLLARVREVSRDEAAASEAVRFAREPLDPEQIKRDARRLTKKVQEAIEYEEREQRKGFEERIASLTRILSDPEGHLRSKRQPVLEQADARLAALQKERDELERAVLEA